MIFTQYWFLEFAAIVLPVYWLLRWHRARELFLLAACTVFHFHYAGPAGVLPIVLLAAVVYLLALQGSPKACIGGIILCAGALIFYKYTEFLCGSIIGVFNKDASDHAIEFYRKHNYGVPLAISFFTFEFVHYLYEVRKKGNPIRNPVDFALFAIFFPSLVAGPIKRYTDFLPSLKSGVQSVNSEDVASGLMRVASGFFKKICIADNLTAYTSNMAPVFSTLPLIERWAVFLGIGMRIYMDFSGYSDIAIGMARMFGIRLPENFNWPYIATSLQNFWQRWHISLSTWIRDYIYIPLGGNRIGPSRRVLNGLVAFALCGLWHGAAWHFVLWGILHGAGLSVCTLYRKCGAPGKWMEGIFARVPLLGWLVTMAFVQLGWLLFFYPAKQAMEMARLLIP